MKQWNKGSTWNNSRKSDGEHGFTITR